jgi:hypothetical protein
MWVSGNKDNLMISLKMTRNDESKAHPNPENIVELNDGAPKRIALIHFDSDNYCSP